MLNLKPTRKRRGRNPGLSSGRGQSEIANAAGNLFEAKATGKYSAITARRRPGTIKPGSEWPG